MAEPKAKFDYCNYIGMPQFCHVKVATLPTLKRKKIHMQKIIFYLIKMPNPPLRLCDSVEYVEETETYLKINAINGKIKYNTNKFCNIISHNPLFLELKTLEIY